MPGLTDADTIRILVATDNHVGVHERDPVRGDDSRKTFHEVMCLAKERDVDMVLLAGDLFHENKPSRKSMYHVMRSLRMNCFGDKPCELEILSDASENFPGAFDHVNYEDLDLNVAIPVFSIHGNHDDPSGEGHLAALDILQVSGLLNYYGRTPESDNILIKPILLQKGRTKLALYGMSNVRDERLFRTFKDHKVKFFRPSIQGSDWFNIMSVHQNHHAYTPTGYLPEHLLPDFLDLVIWGHEHECLIDPKLNPETNFHVMQPGSSVATSLAIGEAVPKHVAILTIKGRDFITENIRLKTVRPFIMREIVLADDKEACKIAKKSKTDDMGRSALTRYLMNIVEDLIEQATTEWEEAQESRSQHSDADEEPVPLPLIRLRVETSGPPDGGTFETENPQRFSNRFIGRVANTSDVVQFHKKKKAPGTGTRRGLNGAEVVDNALLTEQLDSIKIEKLVQEFLLAQSLTILPQNTFGDAVSQFVDKDDKHAMEMFVNESLANQIKHLMALDHVAEDDDEAQATLESAMENYREQLEDLFSAGSIRRSRKRKLKPRPDTWDSDLDGGAWEDQPGALIHSDDEANGNEDEEDDDEEPVRAPAPRGRGRAHGATPSTRGARGATKATPATIRRTTNTIRAKKPTPAKPSTRGKKRAASSSSHISDDDDDDEEKDVMVLDSHDEEEDESQDMFVKQSQPAKRSTRAAPSLVKKQPTRTAAAKTRQSTLVFGTSQASQNQASKGKGREQSVVENISDDDDEDALDPVAKTTAIRRGRR